MPELLRMPEVSAGATTATLCDWLVQENQAYVASDVLATIETDKAVVDFTANADGVLLRVLVSAGMEVPVGTPIALIAPAGETVEDVDAALASLSVTATSAMTPSLSLSAPPDPNLVASPARVTPIADVGECSATLLSNGQNSRIFTSPLARRLAHDAGISTESIIGTGPNSRIVRRDVERAIASQLVSGQLTPLQPTEEIAYPPVTALPPMVTAAMPDLKEVESPTAGDFTTVPHSRVRRAIAQQMTESKQTIRTITCAALHRWTSCSNCGLGSMRCHRSRSQSTTSSSRWRRAPTSWCRR